MDTREVVNAYYQYANSADWNTWMTLFADNVVLEDQIAGRAEGMNGVRGNVDAIKRGYSKFLMHPLHTVVEGDQACVIWHFEAANASGVPIDARGANYFQVHNGKITYRADFYNTVPFAPFINQHLTGSKPSQTS